MGQNTTRLSTTKKIPGYSNWLVESIPKTLPLPKPDRIIAFATRFDNSSKSAKLQISFPQITAGLSGNLLAVFDKISPINMIPPHRIIQLSVKGR